MIILGKFTFTLQSCSDVDYFVTTLFLPHWLPSTPPFNCPSSSFDMSRFVYVIYSLLDLLRFSIALGFEGHIPMVLNPTLMFWLG
jgi:hypothetical protein